MSTFTEKWEQCMHAKGLPVLSAEDAYEALEFVDRLDTAIKFAGGDAEVTIGALIALGAFAGVDEAALAVFGEAAQVAAAVYLGACIGCLGSAGRDQLKALFASNELPDYVLAELKNQGVDLASEAIA